MNKIEKVIFHLKNNQFIVSPEKEFLMPKFKSIDTVQDLVSNITNVLIKDESGWKKTNPNLQFSYLEKVKGKKVIHFRKARRNSRNKKKGHRTIYLKTKIINIE